MIKIYTLLLTGGLLFTSCCLQAGFSATKIGQNNVNRLFHPEQIQAKGELTVIQTEHNQDGQTIYTTSFTNNTLKSADIIDFVNPIPENAIYLTNSAQGQNCIITFSIDGGVTWDKPENLFITLSDGTQRMAMAEDYTHIRWVYEANLAPKASAEVSFAVRVL